MLLENLIRTRIDSTFPSAEDIVCAWDIGEFRKRLPELGSRVPIDPLAVLRQRLYLLH
jgi:hypothetical protein